MKFAIRLAATLSVAALLSACGTNETDTKDKKAGSGEAEEAAFDRDPYPSTYKAYPSDAVLLRDATVYDGLGNVYENYDVLLQDGNIANMGEDLEAGDDTEVVDASGKFVTPGIIDNHSHLGVYPSPSVSGLQDGNEISAPVTAEVWAEHGIWPQDPGFTRALAGGVTSLHAILGGSESCVAMYPGDWAQALIAFDAEVKTMGPGGSRTIPFADLHLMPGAREIIGRCHTNHARSQHQNLHRRRPKSICIGAMVIQP